MKLQQGVPFTIIIMLMLMLCCSLITVTEATLQHQQHDGVQRRPQPKRRRRRSEERLRQKRQASVEDKYGKEEDFDDNNHLFWIRTLVEEPPTSMPGTPTSSSDDMMAAAPSAAPTPTLKPSTSPSMRDEDEDGGTILFVLTTDGLFQVENLLNDYDSATSSSTSTTAPSLSLDSVTVKYLLPYPTELFGGDYVLADMCYNENDQTLYMLTTLSQLYGFYIPTTTEDAATADDFFLSYPVYFADVEQGSVGIACDDMNPYSKEVDDETTANVNYLYTYRDPQRNVDVPHIQRFEIEDNESKETTATELPIEVPLLSATISLSYDNLLDTLWILTPNDANAEEGRVYSINKETGETTSSNIISGIGVVDNNDGDDNDDGSSFFWEGQRGSIKPNTHDMYVPYLFTNQMQIINLVTGQYSPIIPLNFSAEQHVYTNTTNGGTTTSNGNTPHLDLESKIIAFAWASLSSPP